MRGLISDAEHKRVLTLFSRAGLSMDHDDFTAEVLEKATKAILRTRDGMLRAAVPSPLGQCVFLNDVSTEEMAEALRRHKDAVQHYPRQGRGLEAFVDASDTGYTVSDVPVEAAMNGSVAHSNGIANGSVNGNGVVHKKQDSAVGNGMQNGASNGHVLHDDTVATTNGAQNGYAVKDSYTGNPAVAAHNASGPEGVDGLQKKSANGGVALNGNGYSNGVNGRA